MMGLGLDNENPLGTKVLLDTHLNTCVLGFRIMGNVNQNS
jgi:hypothetical protein